MKMNTGMTPNDWILIILVVIAAELGIAIACLKAIGNSIKQYLRTGEWTRRDG